jgi:hypothetical protein
MTSVCGSEKYMNILLLLMLSAKSRELQMKKKNVSANWGGFDLFCKIKRIANEKKMFLQIGVDLISACARRD